MQHPVRLTLSLASTATLALASLPFGLRPATAQEAKTAQGTAADLGVMSISLKDVFKSNLPKLRQSIKKPRPGLGSGDGAKRIRTADPLHAMQPAYWLKLSALQWVCWFVAFCLASTRESNLMAPTSSTGIALLAALVTVACSS